jgi:hypothetical protein
MQVKEVTQFRIELLGIEPPIWRRIQVPSDYSFWDLHVAIQDSMGWLDCHLHQFKIVGFDSIIGIPDEDNIDLEETLPGWELKIEDFLNESALLASYEYDFGDSWMHEVRFEGFHPAEEGISYPVCLNGARRCPPEDCGGIYGYEDFLRIIGDPADPEHKDMLVWAGGSFDPEDFDPANIKFWNPAKRWRIAFQDEEP